MDVKLGIKGFRTSYFHTYREDFYFKRYQQTKHES